MDEQEFYIRLGELEQQFSNKKNELLMSRDITLAELQIKLNNKEISQQEYQVQYERVLRDYELSVTDYKQQRDRGLQDLRMERQRQEGDRWQ